MLPGGLQIVPYTTAPNWWTQPCGRGQGADRGHLLVVVVLFIFLGDVRSSLIVVATLIITPLPPSS